MTMKKHQQDHDNCFHADDDARSVDVRIDLDGTSNSTDPRSARIVHIATQGERPLHNAGGSDSTSDDSDRITKQQSSSMQATTPYHSDTAAMNMDCASSMETATLPSAIDSADAMSQMMDIEDAKRMNDTLHRRMQYFALCLVVTAILVISTLFQMEMEMSPNLTLPVNYIRRHASGAQCATAMPLHLRQTVNINLAQAHVGSTNDCHEFDVLPHGMWYRLQGTGKAFTLRSTQSRSGLSVMRYRKDDDDMGCDVMECFLLDCAQGCQWTSQEDYVYMLHAYGYPDVGEAKIEFQVVES